MQPTDEAGKPLTAFNCDITAGVTLQLFHHLPGARAVEAEAPAPVPEPSLAETFATGTSASVSAAPTDASGPALARGNAVVVRVVTCMSKAGRVTCEQPAGTVHNKMEYAAASLPPTLFSPLQDCIPLLPSPPLRRGLPAGVVTRWGRVWLLTHVPAAEEAADEEEAPEGEDNTSDDASSVSSADSEEEEAPTTPEDCIGRTGLHAINSNSTVVCVWVFSSTPLLHACGCLSHGRGHKL